MSENPYSPPESELGMSTELRRSVWWKIYFFIITIFSFLGIFTYVAAENSGFPEYLLLLSTVVWTVGLFGFCFLRKILFPKFWLVFLVVSFSYGILYLFISKVDLRMGLSDSAYYVSLAIGFLISFPAYFALFSYGRSNNPIWSRALKVG